MRANVAPQGDAEPGVRGYRGRMTGAAKRVLRNLETVLWGAEPPAPPVVPKKWWLTPLAVLLVIGLGAAASQYLLSARDLGVPLSTVVGMLTVLPLTMMWRKPLLAWRIVFVGLLVGGIGQTRFESWPWNPVQLLVVLTVLFVVAMRQRVGVALWVGLSLMVVVTLRLPPEEPVGVSLLIGVVLIAGNLVGRRRRVQLDLLEMAERGELAEAREAVLLERNRIARELHDVVAHSMSLVAVRAETAPYRLSGLSEPAQEEFRALATTARDTLTELRRLLGVLRTDETGPQLAPQPGLSDLEDLISEARQAGMTIDKSLSGVPDSAATGLTAYRIVQEALSNAARHAPGAPVRVSVTATPKQTRVEVHNGPGGLTVPSRGTGHGLVGMRERVELLGGALAAGPTEEGGFAVVATIPGGAR